LIGFALEACQRQHQQQCGSQAKVKRFSHLRAIY
jgi:hypothetical protein